MGSLNKNIDKTESSQVWGHDAIDQCHKFNKKEENYTKFMSFMKLLLSSTKNKANNKLQRSIAMHG